MDCAEGTAADLLLDDVLVDLVDWCAVVVAGAMLCARIECFLCVVRQNALAMARPEMLSGTLTVVVLEAVR